MTAGAQDGVLAALAEHVQGQLGVAVRGTRATVLARALGQRVAACGLPGPDAYVARLDTDAAFRAREAAALGDALAVPETHFFRHAEQLHAFAREVLPGLVAARAPARRLEVLCAGCATGEEAYTLAILLREAGPRLAGWDVRVTAVDVSERALERARAARYETWAFRSTPRALRVRHFVEHGGRAEVRPEVRALVGFERRNLLEEDARFWRPRRFDAIFCRNVFIYFTTDAVARVLARFAAALAPDGLLFLGHADSVRGVASPFVLEALATEGAFAYRLRDGEPATHAPRALPTRLPAASAPQPPPVVTPAPPPVLRPAPPPVPDDPDEAYGRALELLGRERFTEALAVLPPEAADAGPEEVLLRAVLLHSAGRRDAAARVLAALLAAHPTRPEVHHLAGLARDGEGDRLGALAHYERAAQLDPDFALPWLQLGLVRRGTGDTAGAREALAHAARLLPGEAEWRLQLFGGGFSREALLAVCAPPAGGAP